MKKWICSLMVVVFFSAVDSLGVQLLGRVKVRLVI